MLNTEQINNYFQRVYQLAEKGRGLVAPNPMVGALVIKDGQIIAEGYHSRFGSEHAEKVALTKAGELAKGATLFVNLEPCTHYGKQPPCTDIVISSGISELYFAMRDPNPLVREIDGVKLLQQKGVKVHYGFWEDHERRFNEVFYKNIEKKLPFVAVKVAVSLDGKIATAKGESKWITGNESRQYVHRLRNEYMGVFVGVNTVIRDNPQLNVRLDNKKKVNSPYRIILDGHGRTPISSNIIQSNQDKKTIVVLSDNVTDTIKKKFLKAGVELLIVKQKAGRPEVAQLLKQLYSKGIFSILVEGGSEVNSSFLPYTDKFYLFYAPLVIAGKDSISSFGGESTKALNKALHLKELSWEKIGEDLLVKGYV